MSTRACGSTPTVWERWAELQGVHALAAPRFALRAYLQARAADGAPARGIMAQGRWKAVRMVEVYARAEEARRATKWLA